MARSYLTSSMPDKEKKTEYTIVISFPSKSRAFLNLFPLC